MGKQSVARNDAATVERLCRENMRLVHHLARQVYSPLGIDEHVAIGNLGLFEAARRFDPAREVKFSTYATHYIRKYIQMAIVKESGVFRTNDQRKLFWRIKRAVAEGCRTPEEIAAATDVDVEVVRQHSEHLLRGIVSLDAPIRYSDDDDKTKTVGGRLVGDDGMAARIEDADALEKIKHAIWGLSPRLRLVIEKRFLSADTPTLADLARKLGICRERARQLEQRALIALRAILAGKAPAADRTLRGPVPPVRVGLREQQRLLRIAGRCIDCGNKSGSRRRCYRCRDQYSATRAAARVVNG